MQDGDMRNGGWEWEGCRMGMQISENGDMRDAGWDLTAAG